MDEHNAQVLYEFATNTILPMLSPDGVWGGTSPWPLSTEIVKREFERIAQHESYSNGKTIMCQAKDLKWVTLTNGVVKITDHFDPPWIGEPR